MHAEWWLFEFKMKILLSQVDEVFDLDEAGCVLPPGIPVSIKPNSRIKIGDENLGGGSTIADFEKIYGPGKLSQEEGCAIHFSKDSLFHLAIPNDCTENEKAVVKEI